MQPQNIVSVFQACLGIEVLENSKKLPVFKEFFKLRALFFFFSSYAISSLC